MCHRVDKDLRGSQPNRDSFQSWLETGLVILNGARAYCKAKKQKQNKTAIVGSFKMKQNTSILAESCALSLVRQRIKYLSQVIYG